MSGYLWRPWRWPLGVQLAASFALVVALALGGGGALLLWQMEERQLADRASSLIIQATVAANLVTESGLPSAPDELKLALWRFHQQTGVRPVVMDTTGVVVADSLDPSPLLGERLTHREVTQALGGGQVADTRWLGADGWVMYAAVPLYQERQVAGAILVSADINYIDAALRDLRRQLAMVALAAGALAIGLGIGLARYLSRPLERLTRAAGALARGQLQTQVRPSGSREVALLGQSFNRMASELGRLDEQRRAFVANASHELRTPIAAIRALAEALRDDPSNDGNRRREFLGDVVGECDRAARLVDRLLELARLDARRESGGAAVKSHGPHSRGAERAEEIELGELALEIVRALQRMAAEGGVVLTLEAPDKLRVRGDRQLMESVLGNLVENALMYTPSGGQARVLVQRCGEEACVAVSDNGPGIAPEHVQHIFERFYRVDKARARATGGTGLGLAIAAEAASLLGGRIDVQSEVGKGSRFTFVLATRADRKGDDRSGNVTDS